MAELYTELDSVNDMLEAINEQPAETLADSEFGFAIQARDKLKRVHTRLQQQGWKFNRIKKVIMNMTTNGKIPVPTNVISIEKHRDSPADFDYRTPNLWNPTDNSDVFTVAPWGTLTYWLEWEKLPMYFREYATALAVLEFESLNSGDPRKQPLLLERHKDAKGEAKRKDALAHNVNILNFDPAWDIARRGPSDGSANRWEYFG